VNQKTISKYKRIPTSSKKYINLYQIGTSNLFIITNGSLQEFCLTKTLTTGFEVQGTSQIKKKTTVS